MTAPRVGSLFSGYGGLDQGVMDVLGGTLAWYADVCKFNTDGTVGHHEPHRSPCAIMAHHHPDVPNLGDVSDVDWSQVEPVDILTGGSPCQDLSHAGKRKGMTEGTRSNLWVAMREAIAHLRPSLVVWENVRGAYSAAADSELEPCPGCVGDGGADVALRALGRVLGDLSELGYDCRWHGLRAADIGAPHGRFRVFVVAEDTQRVRRGTGWVAAPGEAPPGGASAVSSGSDRMAGPLLPTPVVTDGSSAGSPPGSLYRGRSLTDVVVRDGALLPTPAVNDMGEGKTPDAWDAWTDRMRAAHGNGNGHGKSLAIEAQRLLPTPGAIDGGGGPKRIRNDGRTEADHGPALRDVAANLIPPPARLLPTPMTSYSQRDPEAWRDGRPAGNGQRRDAIGDLEVAMREQVERQDWGIYADAVAQWEAVTRPAPPPTQLSAKGTPQLSPAFSEWMMGLPAGHVTDVPGLSRSDMLKALGNGVVPQQAAAALRFLLSVSVEVA